MLNRTNYRECSAAHFSHYSS